MAFVYGWPSLLVPSRLNYSFDSQFSTQFIPGDDLSTIPFYSGSHLSYDQRHIESAPKIPAESESVVIIIDPKTRSNSSTVPVTSITRISSTTTRSAPTFAPVPLEHMCFLRHAAQYVVPNIVQVALAVALVVGSIRLRHLPDNFRETGIIFVLALVQLVLSSLFAPVYFFARNVDTVYAYSTLTDNRQIRIRWNKLLR